LDLDLVVVGCGRVRGGRGDGELRETFDLVEEGVVEVVFPCGRWRGRMDGTRREGRERVGEKGTRQDGRDELE
jgi:hypothetical protein